MAKRSRTIVVIGFITCSFIYGVPYFFTRDARSCALCHAMRPYYDSWKSSYHSAAAKHCLDCHIKEGMLNTFVFRIYFWTEIKATLLGDKVRPSGVSIPDDRSCVKLGCHGLKRKMSRNLDIRINHEKHVKQFKVACVKCHPGTVHAGINGIGNPLPNRELCFKCHNARKRDCAFCHNKRFTFDILSPHKDN